ncbi:hypothetical protein GCM10023194_18490 [Planotetraspora phitsanulokensis]|uniref:Uncharacterized protein n=1 Tax=Planotetraspora phitsanulokensis TaxID=575192 RepID=A0A8J3XBN3_9ACTN|nr:hypothetical protein Pph01_02130 [Planotetraspora phitsanulokensis]
MLYMGRASLNGDHPNAAGEAASTRPWESTSWRSGTFTVERGAGTWPGFIRAIQSLAARVVSTHIGLSIVLLIAMSRATPIALKTSNAKSAAAAVNRTRIEESR